MRELKSCGVFVFQGDPIESFLLMIHPNRYDIPKGHVDPGETEIQCALRELEEETGITQCDIDLDPEFRFATDYLVQPKKFPNETCHKILVVFLARLLRDIPIKVTEHKGHEWIKWNPPHAIQRETIDPLLSSVEEFISRRA